MKIHLIIASVFLLASCETNEQDAEAVKSQVTEDAKTAKSNVERHTERVANNTRDSIKRTSMKLREWWLTPLPEERPAVVPPRYCYQVMQDIVCYRAPKPGATHMLVGYQGDGAAPPPAAQTIMLPSVVNADKQNLSDSAAARVTAAKPVFKSIPTANKEADDNNQSTTPQSGSEPLPDPALSPQL